MACILFILYCEHSKGGLFFKVTDISNSETEYILLGYPGDDEIIMVFNYCMLIPT